MIAYLRSLRRSYSEYRYKKSVSNIRFFTDIVRSNQNIKSIGIEKNRYILELLNGIKFEWDPAEKNSCLGLTDKPNYEDFELGIIKKILSPDDVVFDIGANFGYFSIYLNTFNPDLKLYSFEPIKSTYDLFLRNCNLNDIHPNTYNLGFSNENNTLTFYLPEKLGSAWASMGKGVKTFLNYDLTEERCIVRKLDDFVTELDIPPVNFIKCDVEGAEKLVVEGAEATLLRDKPVLMLEIGDKWSAHFGYNRVDLIRYLKEHFQYRCFGILKNRVIEVFDPVELQNYAEDHMYNYFFIHPERPSLIALMETYTNSEY